SVSNLPFIVVLKREFNCFSDDSGFFFFLLNQKKMPPRRASNVTIAQIQLFSLATVSTTLSFTSVIFWGTTIFPKAEESFRIWSDSVSLSPIESVFGGSGPSTDNNRGWV